MAYYNGNFQLEGHTYFLGNYGNIDLYIFCRPKSDLASSKTSSNIKEQFCGEQCCHDPNRSKVSVDAADEITKVIELTLGR